MDVSVHFWMQGKIQEKKKKCNFYGFGQVCPGMSKFGQKSRIDPMDCLVDIRVENSLKSKITVIQSKKKGFKCFIYFRNVIYSNQVMEFLNQLYLQIYLNDEFDFLHADRRQKKKDTETLFFWCGQSRIDLPTLKCFQ